MCEESKSGDVEREAFENSYWNAYHTQHWVREVTFKRFSDDHPRTQEYVGVTVQIAWEQWQAAIANKPVAISDDCLYEIIQRHNALPDTPQLVKDIQAELSRAQQSSPVISRERLIEIMSKNLIILTGKSDNVITLESKQNCADAILSELQSPPHEDTVRLDAERLACIAESERTVATNNFGVQVIDKHGNYYMEYFAKPPKHEADWEPPHKTKLEALRCAIDQAIINQGK